MTVRLPRLDQDRHEHNLLAPISLSRAVRDEEEAAEAQYAGDSAWGCLQEWSDPTDWVNGHVVPKSALVERLRFITKGKADDDNEFQFTRDHIRDHQSLWWSVLADWIGVVSSQDLIELGRRRRRSVRQVAMWIADARVGQERGIASLQMPDIRPLAGEPLTRSQLEKCIALAGLETRPPPPWQMLRDARSLMNSGEYRRAVLDAGTAAELALTDVLDTYISANSSPDIAGALMDKTRMLGRLKDLVTKLKPIELPKHFQAQVIDPRNDAAHGGKHMTKQTAEAAIATTTKLLNTTHPLTRFGLPV